MTCKDSASEWTRDFPWHEVLYPMFCQFETYFRGINEGMQHQNSQQDEYRCFASNMHVAPDIHLQTGRGWLTAMNSWAMLRSWKSQSGPSEPTVKACCPLLHIAVTKSHCTCGWQIYALLTGNTVISGWKTTLRKQKHKLSKNPLQQLSCKLLFKNWQCPGAVSNATVSEFEAKAMVKGRNPLYDEQHKTSMEGFDKHVLEELDHSRLIHFVTTTPPLQDTLGTSLIHFVLSRGCPITNLWSWIKWVGAKYGLNLLNASCVRKIRTTSVATHLGDVITFGLSYGWNQFSGNKK